MIICTFLDEVRTGAYRNLWHPDQLISGFEDAANNYARGHFTLGKQLIDQTAERVRKAVDMCDMLQGFFIINSLGGGTGSGFAALLLERLGIEYIKRTKFQIVIAPSSHLSTAVVDPYNGVLSMNASTEHSEICGLFDNESIYELCNNTLDIARPTYNNINRILSQVFSSLTVSLRYESFLNADLDQLSTNLVPYPRIHFPVINYTPIISIRRAEHEKLTTHELTRAVFEKNSQMLSCTMSEGKYMSCCLQYRGDITPKDVNSAIFEVKRRTDIKFVNWCPTGFKLGINSQPPTVVPGSEMAQSSRNVTMITNTTAVEQVWQGLSQKFDVLFSKRSFVHWYVGEGMEEGEFNEAKDEISGLIQDYLEIAVDDEEEEEDESNKADEKANAPPKDPSPDNRDDDEVVEANDAENAEYAEIEENEENADNEETEEADDN